MVPVTAVTHIGPFGAKRELSQELLDLVLRTVW